MGQAIEGNGGVMEKGTFEKGQSIPLAFRAEQALKEAVAEAIADHKRNGDPIVVWQDGKVVKVAADQIEIRGPTAVNGVRQNPPCS